MNCSMLAMIFHTSLQPSVEKWNLGQVEAETFLFETLDWVKACNSHQEPKSHQHYYLFIVK